ncbi:MAG: hypothetical protein BGO25_13990 [Acidobacteriales bacterium 59-55]|nr:MAG: hypothetical protein BGO25_13990 [Acidobacteriales bacterium 59-55]
MPQPSLKSAQIALRRAPAPPVYRPMTAISQRKPTSVPTAGQRAPVWRLPVSTVSTVQGKLGVSAAMNRQPIRNPVVQRMEDLEEPEVEEHFWIPRKYYRPKAPTLGDWLTPALAPYQRRERQIARSRAGMVRAQERREQSAKRYNFHDLTAARPVLDSVTAPRPPLGIPVWAPPVAAAPQAVVAVPVVVVPVVAAPVVPPAAAAAVVAAPIGTPDQRFAAMCNGNFWDKHTATSKQGAQRKADRYGGTVTVINRNATNATTLENTRGVSRPVVTVTGWKFVNGVFKASGQLRVGIFRGTNGFDHLDFTN